MILSREFFERDTVTAARELVGQILVRKTPQGVCRGIVVETEAYLGKNDPAAHSYKGSRERTRALYGEKGCAYIYLIYGMYSCLNVSSGETEEPECILIRAVEPIDGIDIMSTNRKTDKIRNLCSGPGKLCMAMDIDRSLYGTDMCDGESEIYFEMGEPLETAASPRINVDYAGEAAKWPLRFTAKDNLFISKRP